MSRVIKIRCVKGSYFIITFYSAKTWDDRFAPLGALIMDEEDWNALKENLNNGQCAESLCILENE